MTEKNRRIDEIEEVLDKKTAEKERREAAERFTATADEFVWGNEAEEWAKNNKRE